MRQGSNSDTRQTKQAEQRQVAGIDLSQAEVDVGAAGAIRLFGVSRAAWAAVTRREDGAWRFGPLTPITRGSPPLSARTIAVKVFGAIAGAQDAAKARIDGNEPAAWVASLQANTLP